jgi:hypothetical protein
VVVADRCLVVLAVEVNRDAYCSLVLEVEPEVDSVEQNLRVLMVVDLHQEGGVVQAEVPALAVDEEGHFVAVEILQEALWQRHLEELRGHPRCWTSECAYVSAYLQQSIVYPVSPTSQNSAHPTRYGW